MDRNGAVVFACPPFGVATREGGVDRNTLPVRLSVLNPAVATREGGVDRNKPYRSTAEESRRSPPARVAWIETPDFP